MSNELIRLSKLMAHRGLCSRREADTYIEKGLVLVEGEVLDQLGAKVYANVSIELKQLAQKSQTNKLTILLNKPLGYVSCLPEKGYRPAIDLIIPSKRDPQFKTALKLPSYLPKIAVAGRLDINSKGLLILTQDGRLAKQLIGNETDIEKEYLVRVSKELQESQLELLRFGLSLDGQALKPAKIDQLKPGLLRVTLKEGKKRQIRRMCALVHSDVLMIKRVRIGKVHLKTLKEGFWRFLEPSESF